MPTDFFKNIETSWPPVKFKYITARKKGAIKTGPFGSQLKNSDLVPSGIKVFNQRNVLDNCFNSGNNYISEKKYEQLKDFKADPGDILITSRGTIGKAAVLPDNTEEGILHPCLIRIKINEHKAVKNYILRFINDSVVFKENVLFNSNATTIDVIYGETLKDVEIPLPDLQTQTCIISFLDRKTTQIDTLIEKKKKQIELLKEQRAVLINQAVTKGLNPDVEMKDSGIEWIGNVPNHWDVLKIKRLSHVKRGASPRPIDDSKYFNENGEFAWVRISDVTASQRYLNKTTQKLSELGSSLSVKMYPGDFFVSIAGTVGKPIITKIKCCIHDGFVYFPYLNVNKEYFYYLFSGGELYKGLGKWGTQLNLNTETIGDIYIPLPPTKEINGIVNFLDRKTAQLNTVIHKINSHIEFLIEYRLSLISNAVTGKLEIPS